MNCDKCQELLSDFFDDALGGEERALLGAHLEECLNCAGAQEEFQSILGVARASREEFVAPPNEHALWLRIRNTIESDSSLSRASAAARTSTSLAREGFWARLLNKRWEFTLPQMATAVAAVAVAVSLVTTLGLQYLSPGRAGVGAGSAAEVERAERGKSLRGLYRQGYIEPRQASLQYWQQRVEQRKANWHPRMRESFDRSVTVLDQTVSESLSDLEQNPHDEIAEQMLNSALHDKMELLREFGEQ